MVRGDVAIIGMSCLFPGAPDLDTYWQNIVSKVDAITDPPPEAWDADVFYDPDSTANDRVYCKRGGFLGPLAYFDPLKHGVMPLAVEGGEPDQWLALQVARAALTDAGYGDEIPERHRTAVILGKGNYPNRGNSTVSQHGRVVDQTLEILKALHPEYTEADLQSIRQELKQCLPAFNSDTAPGLIPNIIAGRIANRLDLMGPNYTVDAACASFLVAANTAVRGLCHREYDLALIGGSHGWTPVPMLALFCQLGALSRREQIRPFDRDADGTILGEGIGMIVLKRREDAERDGNRIYAIIKGVGVASDGRGLSVTAPRVEGEIMALERAYEEAGVSPRTIGLIEAHGTGTPVGDATEIEALTRVFGPRDGVLPWCAIGSVKSMVGHLMPAAGVAGLIKTALALYHKVLPPTLNVDEANPVLELENTPFYINTETRPWVHGAQDVPRRAGVNAFGFGGINAHVILEEYHDTVDGVFQSHYPHWDTEVFLLSAGSRPELIQQAEQLHEVLQAVPELSLKDLAYTLNVPLHQEPCRVSIVASSVADLEQKLSRTLKRLSDPECDRIKDAKGIYFFEQRLAESGQLAFMFPGEGSQYVNMLADLCIHFPEVRAQFDLIDRVFAEHGREYVLSDVIFPPPIISEDEREVGEEQLWRMEGAVEAVLTASRGLFSLLNRLGIDPDVLVGHSTGEYSAMLVSGMIDLSDEDHASKFATELNQIYQQAAVEGEIPRAGLVAVGAARETVADVVKEGNGDIYVAMDNCPHQTVIVGSEAVLEGAVEQLQRRGLICDRLPFDRPYHTPLFKSFSVKLQTLFARWLISQPRIPTYSCTAASPFPDDLTRIQELAVEHWTRPVEFRKTIEAMYNDGVRIFVEVGPRGNLTAFVDDVLRGRPHLAVAADVMQRSGIAQLNHLVGILAAHGVPMQLDHLYARRSPRKLDLSRPDALESHGQRAPGRMKLLTGWPTMTISEETAKRVRSRAQPAPATAPLADETHMQRVTDATHSSPEVGPAASVGAEGALGAVSQTPQFSARTASSAQVMSAHLRTMEQFLTVQQEVMQAFLAGAPPGPPALPPSGTQTRDSSAADEQNTQQVLSSASVTPQADVMDSPAQSLPSSEGSDGDSAVSMVLDAEGISEILLQMVSERTGYPVEMLDLNLDLEADLGIDSIKRVEILGSFQRQTGLLGAEEMEALAGRKTLQEVIDFLSARSTRPMSAEPESSLDATPGTPVEGSQGISSMPLLERVVSLSPGEELVVRYEVNPDEDIFLLDHTLGRQVAVTDLELRGLPVMPLTMSMEMLAEAAALLAPDERLVGMRDVRAYRWIAFECNELALELVARRVSSATGRDVKVQIRRPGDTAPIVEGTMVFDKTFPEPPLAGAFALQDERPSRWAPEQLYRDVMFHGPSFRGVVSMDRWGSDGAEATLEVLPSDTLLRSDPDPAFITDPVLLDQPGQVVAFWTSDHLETGYVIFPFRLEALHLYGPSPRPPERVQCRARIILVGEEQVRSDLELLGPDGRLWARLDGWWDRRFDVPNAVFRALLSPRDVTLSEPWSMPVGALPASADLCVYRLGLDAFPEGFFSAHGSIWRDVMAHIVFGRRERELWRGLKTPEPRRLEWLLGRIAAKDAVRQYVKQRYNIALCPADVEILPDASGRPVVHGSWLEQMPWAPMLSLSHTNGVAVAVVGHVGAGEGVGIDLEQMGRMDEGVKTLAFDPQEQELLSSLRDGEKNGWPLRFWCAKEAVAKAVGQGMIGGPQALVVETLDVSSGMVQISLTGELARRVPDVDGSTLSAFTAREGDLVLAISLFERKAKDGGA